MTDLRDVSVALAGPDDTADLARLLWEHASPDEQRAQEVGAFAVDLGRWLSGHGQQLLQAPPP